jgi:hypothetical protein
VKERTGLVSVLTLIIVAALTYLPLINQIGYSYDDWYLMASARAEGADVFHEIYSVDRPLRAYVLEPAYRLFGQNVLLYNLSAWTFRVLGALLLLWMLRMLWPNHPHGTSMMALLYVLYPGFLSQPNGIDYQPQIISLALAMLSLALTVYAFFAKGHASRVAAVSLSILLGILYLGLVEYEAGFEFVRLMGLFILAGRLASSFRERVFRTIQAWLPYSLILLGFGVWRIFFFQGERKATDIDIQFEQVRLYPLQTLYHWTVQVIQDLYDVMFSAWTIPLSQLTAYIQRWGSVIAILTAGLILIVSIRFDERNVREDPLQPSFAREALLLGLLSAIGGLIPIAMVNREVSFPFFSRYSLTSSVGVSIFIVALLSFVNGRILRKAIVPALIFVAMLTHHANAVKYAQETSMLKMFWWQVSWRVPHLQKGTTLIAEYPVAGAQEDYFVWGPASLIYYPEKQNPEAIQPGLYAAVLNSTTVTSILARERQQYDNRKNIVTYPNYRNILVLTQPALDSCVHTIDGNQPEYSRAERDSIRVVGPYSELEHVLADEAPQTPPTVVFGPEPTRVWCYYYEKADLARQRGDWEEVMHLGAQALDKGFAPRDKIEWIPFLQAYAVAGDAVRLAKMASAIAAEPYISLQACQHLSSLQGLSGAVREVVDSLYCLE